MPKVEDRSLFVMLFELFGVSFIHNGSANVRAAECPFCGGDKFYLNGETGQYKCHRENNCGAQGNAYAFVRWVYDRRYEMTSDDDYRRLKDELDIPLQTLKRHGLALDDDPHCWLIPFKSTQGEVVNLMRYYPGRPKPNKFMLPGLPTSLYGFDRLAAADKGKPVFLCEGPLDAIALDASIGAENRPKYVLVATPGAFREVWAEHFRGRKVRAFYDNDKAGRGHTARVQKLLGEGRVADELLALHWPDGTPDGYDVRDLVRDHPGQSVLGWLIDHCYKVIPEPKLAWEHGWLRGPAVAEADDWVWPDRLPCDSYVSYSGKRGTLKSTVMRELIARYTRNEPLPGCCTVGLPAGHVILVTAEDSTRRAWEALELAGADTQYITVLPATLKDGDPMNILEHLDELRQTVRQYGVRLVVIDGQNSVVGAPCIATDMLARHNVTNKLHQFAQQEKVCLVGIRNEDQDGRALGPQSMSDLGRAILRSVELKPDGDDRYFELRFERISDRAPSTHPPIPYSVEDLGGSSRRILWGKVSPVADPEEEGPGEDPGDVDEEEECP
jgi:hypothetical protein